MSSFPGSPRIVKGAIIGIDPMNLLASVVVFQYNPSEITRSLTPASPSSGVARGSVMRLAGAPTETFSLKVRLNAADQLEKADPLATSLGLYPQISALEMLVYPKTALVISNAVLLSAGVTEVIPPEAPFTLVIWGPKRVLPVKVTNMSIAEQAWDPNLNPIQAEVTLSLQTLSYNDFSITHPGFSVFLAHQVIKETMAVIGSVSNIAAVAGGTSIL